MKSILAWSLLVTLLGCANVQYSAADCEADLNLAKLIAQEIIADEIDDEVKARKAAFYAEIASRLAARGCGFIPPPDPADLENALSL